MDGVWGSSRVPALWVSSSRVPALWDCAQSAGQSLEMPRVSVRGPEAVFQVVSSQACPF